MVSIIFLVGGEGASKLLHSLSFSLVVISKFLEQTAFTFHPEKFFFFLHMRNRGIL